MRKTLVLTCVLLAASLASAQYPMVDNIPGTFIDIGSTGTPLNVGDDTESPINTTVGNALLPAGAVHVGSNGGVGLVGDTQYVNGPIPSGSYYGGGVGLALFWDDLQGAAGGGAGDVYWQEIGNTLIIEWKNIAHYFNTGAATFELQIFNPGTGPGYAQYLYQDMNFNSPSYDFGASATVGYQTNGTTGVQWSMNQPVIQDGTVLTIVPEPGSLGLLALGALALIRRR